MKKCDHQNIFPSRLSALRKEMSQAQMAKKIGISQQNYNRYESGQAVPRSDVISQICRATGVSADWLLGLDDATPQPNPRAEAAEEKLRAVKKSLIALVKGL